MVFAILLNSVGTVILQSIYTFGVDKPQASLLELFKDLPIAITSFLVASFLPLLGYRRSMMTRSASLRARAYDAAVPELSHHRIAFYLCRHFVRADQGIRVFIDRSFDQR